MADTTTTKILEVVVDNKKAIPALTEYNRLIDEQKAIQRDLAQQLKDKKISEADYYKELTKSKEITKTYSRQVQELSKELQNNIKMDQEQAGSLRALRAELSNVTKQYDALSAEERKAAKGLELRKKINEITDALKDSEEQTGRFYRNVGNYAGSLSGLFWDLSKDLEDNTAKITKIIGGITSALKRTGDTANQTINPIANMRKGFMALSATPLIAILGALVTVIQKVIQNLKSSEETMNAVAVAMAPLNAVGRVVQRTVQALGDAVGRLATKLAAWAEKLNLVTDAMKTEQQLVKDNIELQKRERDYMVENAKAELNVSKLRAEAADKIKYSAQERIELLKQAMAEEEGIARRELELAKERNRILEEQSKLAANSKEENDELARSRAAVYEAEKKYYDKTRELQAQIVEATNQIRAEQKAAGKDRIETAEAELSAMAILNGLTQEQLEKALDIRQREVEARLKLVEKGSLAEYILKQDQLQAQLDADLQRLQSEEGTDNLILLRRQQFVQDMEALDQSWHDASMAEAEAIVDEVLEGIWKEQEARKDALEKQKAQELEKQQLAQDSAAAFGDVAGSIANMLQTFGEENKELTKLAKVIALAQIAIETGVATAKAISAAMGKGFPGALVDIAMAVTAITSGMASAISTVKGAKFATGGYVSGPGTGTSDSIPARLSNGESVINARSTAMFGPLLSSLNQAGGGIAFNPAAGGSREGFDFLAAAVASGMKHAQIHVAVDEVKQVQDRVEHIKAVSTIGG